MSLKRPAKNQPKNFEFNTASLEEAKNIIAKYPKGKHDYGLIIVSNPRYRKKIKNIALDSKTKISCIGKIIRKKGIHFDSQFNIDNFKEFDHFS